MFGAFLAARPSESGPSAACWFADGGLEVQNAVLRRAVHVLQIEPSGYRQVRVELPVRKAGGCASLLYRSCAVDVLEHLPNIFSGRSPTFDRVSPSRT